MNLIRRPFRYSYDNLTLWLIGINAVLFIAGAWVWPWLPGFMAMNPVAVVHGWLWQFVTYMFAHGSVNHILFNMLALLMFGSQVERHMGSREFLLYYLVTGVLAGVLSFLIYFLTGAWGVYLLGASGAIFAVELAYAVFFPHARLLVLGILPVRAPILVLVFTGIEVFSLFTGFRAGVAHLTHLAGFAIGWLYFLSRFSMNPWRELVRK